MQLLFDTYGNPIQNINDFGFELGGPIIKDKLWFHAGFNPNFEKKKFRPRLIPWKKKVDEYPPGW